MISPKSAEDVQTEGSLNGDKIKIKFIFANRDGINVEIECSPFNTIGNLKQSLISEWPKELNDTPPTSDRIRLICMGKGILGPDNVSIEQNELPVFVTHPTPINVSVKPLVAEAHDATKGIASRSLQTSSSLNSNGDSGGECCCVVS